MTGPVLGLAPWSPSPKRRLLVADVLEILDTYSRSLPLTVRQVFYRLTTEPQWSVHGWPKTEKFYKKVLIPSLARARRAGMVPWSAIRDDKQTALTWGGEESPVDAARDLLGIAESYSRDRMEGQDPVVEVWVEAQGMVPQVRDVVESYGCEIYSSGGFNSVTSKYQAGVRAINRYAGQDPVTTLALHVGDRDPSGEAIYENLSLDVPAMVRDLLVRDQGWSLGEAWIVSREISDWRRIVVTPEQIERYDLPSAPPKSGDSRIARWEADGMGETVQAEAMTPDELADEIRDAVRREVDLGQLKRVTDREERERDILLEHVEGPLGEAIAELEELDE